VSSERIIKYLSERHGVNINAATFQYFREPDGSELLARVFLIEPSELELSTRRKGASKRRPNLTYEELNARAAEKGIEDLYRYAVTAFERRLQKHTTQTSIGFTALLDGSRKTIVSLLPGESGAGGLRYQLYKNRYDQLTNLSPQEVEERMPASHEHWEYLRSDPDYNGFQGFIRDREEIDRISRALTHEPSSAAS
jgi:hypothetical protein